jgi:hypothetical protein
MSIKLTGAEDANLKIIGKIEEIEKVMQWFKNPIISEDDIHGKVLRENLYEVEKFLSDNNKTPNPPYTSNYDIKKNDTDEFYTYSISANREGYTAFFWDLLIRKINEISPTLEIYSKAHAVETHEGQLQYLILNYTLKSGWKEDFEFIFEQKYPKRNKRTK